MKPETILKVLAIIAALTTLTVQGIKKILDEKGISYSPNLLAVITSAFLTISVCVGYVLYCGIPFTVQTIITILAMVYLSFLTATEGYDKIKQLWEQLHA